MGAGPPPITCTAACPLREPTRASTIATPAATPVTVPLLSTRATTKLLDDQMKRTVGMTFPARSNAVARSPVRSPTLIVTEGGATWTSATFWATLTAGRLKNSAAARLRGVMAPRT